MGAQGARDLVMAIAATDTCANSGFRARRPLRARRGLLRDVDRPVVPAGARAEQRRRTVGSRRRAATSPRSAVGGLGAYPPGTAPRPLAAPLRVPLEPNRGDGARGGAGDLVAGHGRPRYRKLTRRDRPHRGRRPNRADFTPGAGRDGLQESVHPGPRNARYWRVFLHESGRYPGRDVADRLQLVLRPARRTGPPADAPDRPMGSAA